MVRQSAGRYVRWFRRGQLGPEDRVLVAALRDPVQRRVLRVLLAQDGARFTPLQEATGLAPASVSRALRLLKAGGLVVADPDRGYRLADAEAVRMELALFRRRFPDLLVEAALEIFDE